MTPERYGRIVEIFEKAIARPPEARAAFLTSICAGDADLRREVEAMLATDSKTGGFLETPPHDLAAAAMPRQSLLGRTLADYRLVSLLGAGGMGRVYLAEDTRLGRKAALKLLPEEFAADPDRVRRFEQEARAVSALNHPNIVTIYGVGQEGPTNFLATEYVEGRTLAQVMAEGPLPSDIAIDIALQAASALAAAHQAGIVHRDIKPENIVWRPDGLVKVLDFGLAKITRKFSGENNQTIPGMVIGTPSYMSPEQARGLDVDRRSDIFSLGAVMYGLLAGKAAFEGATATDILAAIVTKEPSALPHAQPGLETIVRRCLQKERDRRYPSALELAADLRALPSHKKRFPRKPAAIFLAAAALAAICFFSLRGRNQPIDSLAVLPFTNASSDPTLEYLSDGLTDELIDSLTLMLAPDLRVMARSSVFTYKGHDPNPQKVGSDLHVRAILTGRVTQRAGRIAVQAELVNSENGAQLWGHRYEGEASGLQSIQREIAQEITARLRPKLTATEAKRIAAPSTANPHAYDLYLQGRHAIAEMAEDRIRKSLVYFQQAISLDPSYAQAYAGLADSYIYLGILELADPREVMPQAKAAALQALALDRMSSEAHTSLGVLNTIFEVDLPAAAQHFSRALELNPGNAYSQHWRAHYYETVGRWEDALRQMGKALELDPLSPMIGEDIGLDFYFNRQYDAAIQQLRKVLRANPEELLAHGNLALALEAYGQGAESLRELDATRRQSANLGFVAGSMAGIYCRAGHPGEARKIQASLVALARKQYVCPLELAMTAFALGEQEPAFGYLQSAVAEHSSNLFLDTSDPVFDPVRRDPRFVSLMDRAGYPKAGYWAMSPAAPEKNQSR